MRDKILISIVDEKGSRQFNLHRLAKKIILYLVLSLVVLIVGGFFLMTFLMEQVKEIDAIKEQNIDRYRAMFVQNQSLKKQINQKSSELIEVGKRVEDLEEIIDYSKNKDVPITQEINLSGVDAKDQFFLLQIIPNGHPIKKFEKITPIKERLHPLKKKYGVNSGIDYLVASGTPVFATADGIVELVQKRASIKGYGKFAKITHAYGFSSLYGHLSEVLVNKGDFVKKGQLIGYSGRSGMSQGERLCYEVRFLGSPQDALAFAYWDSEHFESIFKKEGSIDWNRLFWALEDLRDLQAYQDR
ncbi:M23 family metallopeptidase [Helicobacter kayseriensis]|uniref:M23 family metallopeptidase n=1 Tax=Helicobacter kayseriensis TaxID=2905877 RepID=UPI001E39BB1A|nr:M23 family metallopeptidase [Helicobacter kayseriensis]MCE3047085.1 M23 family metallopeptidase [Helicobacter kayseriensis]MCE3048255.1 M23 family metallopeptidase [Helicobacter kayseriensis]